MPTRIEPTDEAVVLRFGGGENSRASEDEIDPRECASGHNYLLDIENREYRNRPAFDLVGTTPNSGRINGFITLDKSDGTCQLAVQSGTEIYEWDGSSFSSSIQTVSSSARLRGHLWHNWQLEDKVIVTDIALDDVVMEWDGTVSGFVDVTFTKDPSTTSFGTFKARYCVVDNDRAYYANIVDPGGTFPHIIVGSKREDYAHLSAGGSRPSTSLADDDPFYLIAPDLRHINGMVQAYGVIAFSTRRGSMYQITGVTPKTDSTIGDSIAVTPLYPRSGASGDESVVYVGNDILYGRQGRIESLVASEEFGDVETNDLSIPIANRIEDYETWRAAYNSRLQRVYFHPDTEGEFWVLYKSIVPSGLSPWAKYVSAHTLNFNPTVFQQVLDPADNLEYVFMGDDSGNVYRLEGAGTSGDGGTTEIATERLSRIFNVQLNGEVSSVEGWIKTRRGDEGSVTIAVEYQGERIFNHVVQIGLDAHMVDYYYGGSFYYGGGAAPAYYDSTFRGKIDRRKFTVPAGSTEFQIRLSTNQDKDVTIQEVGLRFITSS